MAPVNSKPGCFSRAENLVLLLLLLYLYRARNKITQLSIPTHAQLQRHRLKFIKNHLKNLLHVSVFDHLQGVTMSPLKSLLLLTTVGCFYAKSGDVAACRVDDVNSTS